MSLSLTVSQPATAAAGSDAELEALAEAALLADINAKEAAEAQKSAKDAFKKALEARQMLNSDTKQVGVVRTIVKATRRFDKTLAAQLLTEDEIAKYSSLDGALVKANVAPAVYEMFQRDYGFSLEVKVGE